MKTGLIMDDPHYYIDEIKRTVVCTITIRPSATVDVLDYLEINSYKTTVRGIAKCAPEDEFNMTIGMRIAESKAKAKAFKKMAKLLQIVYTELEAQVDKLKDMYDFNKFLSFKELEHVKELGDVIHSGSSRSE